jgi:hypothetical protein
LDDDVLVLGQNLGGKPEQQEYADRQDVYCGSHERTSLPYDESSRNRYDVRLARIGALAQGQH